MATINNGSSILNQADADQLEAWLGAGPLSLTNIYAYDGSSPPTPIDDFLPAYQSAVNTWGLSKGEPFLDSPMFVVLKATIGTGAVHKIGGYAHHFGRVTKADYRRASAPAGSTTITIQSLGGTAISSMLWAAVGITPGTLVVGPGIAPGTVVNSVFLLGITVSKPTSGDIGANTLLRFVRQSDGVWPYPDRTAFLFNLTTGKRWMQRDDGNHVDTRRPQRLGAGKYQVWGLEGRGPRFGGGHCLYVNHEYLYLPDEDGKPKKHARFFGGGSHMHAFGARPDGAVLNASVFDDTPDSGRVSFTLNTMELFGVN